MTIYPELLMRLFTPFVGGADGDLDVRRWKGVDLTSAKNVESSVVPEILRELAVYGPRFQDLIRDAFAYHLIARHEVLRKLDGSFLFPFELPPGYLSFFQTIWNSLYAPTRPEVAIGCNYDICEVLFPPASESE